MANRLTKGTAMVGRLVVDDSGGQVDLSTIDDFTVGGSATITESVTAADLIATDDLTVGDDADITGTLTVGAGIAVTGGIVLTNGSIQLPKLGADPAAPGADKAVLYLKAGTSGVALYVRAGTAGAATVVLDNIPVS